MSADQLIQNITWAVFCVLFVLTAISALRNPQPVQIHTALFFSAPAAIIFISIGVIFGFVQAGALANAVNSSLIMLMTYLLLLLVGDFSAVPRWAIYSAAISLVLLSIGAFVFPSPRPLWLTLLQLGYVLLLVLYPSWAFAQAARRASGVTRRRMICVALGCGLLGALFIAVTLIPALPNQAAVLLTLNHLCGLGASISYYLGFTPPRSLRRAWQEPELRRFLKRAAQLPRLPETGLILREIERGAASSIGAPHASVGLWDEAGQLLCFEVDGERIELSLLEELPVCVAFRSQKALFVADMAKSYPASSATSKAYGAQSLLAAPITAAERRIGVLAVYAPYTPVFAEDDLDLIQLLAEQAAVVLESRALIDEATRVQAREEMTRLKDDFLSAAAHDLKTPLTVLIMKAQHMNRRAKNNPEAPADHKGLQLIVQEAERLRRLVLELLDATRAEQGQLLGPRTETDLSALARSTIERYQSDRHTCVIRADEPLIGTFDDLRIQQLFDNLLENAIKYSPAGGTVVFELRRVQNEVRISVQDQGIGIPAPDLKHIFDRFYRAGNVDDRRYAGMGLGLFICRSIVEQHSGQVSVTSELGQGTTFTVILPLSSMTEAAYV